MHALGLLSAALLAVAAPPEANIDWQLAPAQILPACKAEIDGARAAVAAASDLRAVEAAQARMSAALAAHRLLAGVATGEAARASLACNEALAAFRVSVSSSAKVYALAQAALAAASTQPDKQLAILQLEASRRAGAALDAGGRARVEKLIGELEVLQNAFVQAMGQDPPTVALSPEEAASLPPAMAGGDPTRVPVQMHLLEQFLRTQPSSAARERYLRAYYNIGGAANLQRLQRALEVRDAIARALGFQNWAEHQLAVKMARTPSLALLLLREVAEKSLPKARAEIAALGKLKGGPLFAWDYSYYQARFEAARAVDGEQVRQYFPAAKVVPAIFRLYEKLFGIEFKQVTPYKPWAVGVSEYAIGDRGSGKHIGWLFLDIEPREGKSLRPSAGSLREGGPHLPIAAIIGNGPAGKPALFSHHDVLELFHEMGHVLHMLLSTAPYAALNGSQVRGDFVEAPSQMMEELAWQPAVLQEISSHVTSGKPLPAQLIERMIGLRHSADGYFWSRQAFMAIFDLELHRSGPKVDANVLWFALQSKLMALQLPEGTMPPASFLPVMGGYDANYYGYLWSKVYAADMFTAFLQKGVESPEVGMRYRREILEPGGGVEPDVLLKNFLGRPPRADAFYRSLGIEK